MVTVFVVSAVLGFVLAGPVVRAAGTPSAKFAQALPSAAARPRKGIRGIPVMTAGGLQFKGDGVAVTDSMRAYAEKKLAKPIKTFGAYANGPLVVSLKVEHGGHGEAVQPLRATVALTGQFIDRSPYHVEAHSGDLYEAIDAAEDKLVRKMREYKEKTVSAHQKGGPSDKKVSGMPAAEDSEEEEEGMVPAETK